MRAWTASVAVLMAVSITPIYGEIAENAVHWLVEGHAAHAEGAHEHEPANDEHGCSGPFHVCPCHQTAAFEPSAALQIPIAFCDAVGTLAVEVVAPPAAPVRAVYRPPIG